MLFLMNDAVLDLASVRYPGARLKPLPLEAVGRLGQELYAETPLLHLIKPAKARRLASLILAAAPGLNAALFVAPAFQCAPEDVTVRFAQVDTAMMSRLSTRQDEGQLDTLWTDRQVWRRLAA